jgi:hypothetical protein
MAATEPADFHQPQVQNIYGCFFATGHFEDLTFVNLTFCKPDVSEVLKQDVLKPDVLKPGILWVYLLCYIDVKYIKNIMQIIKHNHRNVFFSFL